MTTFTAFCQEADGSGTIWISTVEVEDDNVLTAISLAREACAEDWDYDPEDIHVLGIARGDVEICHWVDSHWVDICDREG